MPEGEAAFTSIDPMDDEAICRVILARGLLQVSQGERDAKRTAALRDIAQLAAAAAVDPSTNRPWPASAIEQAMKDELNFSVHPSTPAKAQAMAVITQLAERGLSIARARMRLRVTAPSDAADAVWTAVAPLLVEVESEDRPQGALSATGLCAPSMFASICDEAQSVSKRAVVEVITGASTEVGSIAIE